MAEVPEDERETTSIRIFDTTLRRIIEEQHRLRMAGGRKVPYPDLVERAWTVYEQAKQQGTKGAGHKGRGSTTTTPLPFDARQLPLIEQFLAFYYSEPTGRDKYRDMFREALRQLFPDPLSKQNDDRRRA